MSLEKKIWRINWSCKYWNFRTVEKTSSQPNNIKKVNCGRIERHHAGLKILEYLYYNTYWTSKRWNVHSLKNFQFAQRFFEHPLHFHASLFKYTNHLVSSRKFCKTNYNFYVPGCKDVACQDTNNTRPVCIPSAAFVFKEDTAGSTVINKNTKSGDSIASIVTSCTCVSAGFAFQS